MDNLTSKEMKETYCDCPPNECCPICALTEDDILEGTVGDNEGVTSTSMSPASTPIIDKQIKKAIKMLEAIPPSPIGFKCSRATWENLKESTHKSTLLGLTNSLSNITVEIGHCLTDDQLQIIYNNGTTEIVKLKV